jgi:cytochrome b subunit of formate dehydrogenase
MTVREQIAEQMCARCHTGVKSDYAKSAHGVAFAAGTDNAPTCSDCHAEHVTDAGDSTMVGEVNEVKLCMSCHLDDPNVQSRVGPSAGFIASYETSVHGQAAKQGNGAAATCVDCHGSHEMKGAADPSSKVWKQTIARTCGACHLAEELEYEQSIHGKAVASGIMASATCTDCHGEHEILSPRDARARIASENVSSQVCSPCHASVRLTEKYGLSSDRFKTFQDSYHGLAGQAGSVEVANCASCHGIHDIKPSADPTSRIHKSNLAKTCGSCHPGANENFAKGQVHVIASAGGEEVLYIVSTAYIILLVIVIGGMLIHNLLDFIKKSRMKLAQRRGLVASHPVSHRLYLRMSLSERVQHGVLLVSFTLLVITGFALRFPNAWWVEPVREISPIMFELRSLTHRVAGVVLVLAGCYHLYYVLFVPRGKRLMRDLVPVKQDITDAVMVLKHNLGLSTTRPKFGRFSYIEKSEYWALVWGTVVMALTGLILWFDNTFLGILSKLWWDVARTVHYYEAWLATLAILVWHFYFVIFNPNTYPLNLAFWKGTLTEEEMEEEHPLELQQIRQSEEATDRTEESTNRMSQETH